MESVSTPQKENKKLGNIFTIPASPLMKKIGYGTGVAVYELQRSSLSGKFQSPWAVKKVIKNFSENLRSGINSRLEYEAGILRKLNHSNIVGFRAHTQTDGLNILAMEECSNSLGDLIENRLDNLGLSPFPPNIIFKVCNDVAKALDYLHNEAFLLHCDIKSYNVLINGDFRICKLCDFGVCLPLTKKGVVDVAKTGEVNYPGTPSWNPPEVFHNHPNITTKADIYSFGLVIWEMLSLAPPFFDEEDLENTFTDSISEKSFMDDSNLTDSDSFANNSFDERNSNRRRPDLPDVEFGPEYYLILEMYFCCTFLETHKRISARDLVHFLGICLLNNK